MENKLYTTTAPAYWACYFLYDDASYMDNDEQQAADAFYATLGGQIVNVGEDTFFSWTHDADAFFPYGSDCVEYTVQLH